MISSLSGGGAERALVLLAKGLTTLGHQVSVVTIFGKGHDFYQLPDGVDRAALGLGRDTSNLIGKIADNARRLRALRSAIRSTQPDVVISFLRETNVLTLLSTVRLSVPVIVTEHVDSRRQPLGRMWACLRRVSYRRATRLVSVSAGVDNYFTWLPKARRAVIDNPISLADLRSEVGEALTFDWSRTVIAVGRLETEKGFDLLINAFAVLAADFPEWGLAILGEGGQRRNLQSLIARLGLIGRVCLPGALREPFPTLKRADLFVLSSRHEGFGNALVEAMACGLPAIATDCWSQAPGIVRHGVDGILVPPEDVPALAAAMADLMADEAKRRSLGHQGMKAAERFDLDRVMTSWNHLLETVVSPPRAGSR